MRTTQNNLSAEGLQRFRSLEAGGIDALTERFYRAHGAAYAPFGPRGRETCREDLAYHLEFLRPVLEFGLLEPMVEYLRWLGSELAARSIPAADIGQSLDWLAEFFETHMAGADGALVGAALRAAAAEFLRTGDAPQAKAPLPDAWPETAPFQAALLAGRQRDALDIMNRCLEGGRGFVDFEMHVIQPAMYRIGELWQANQVSVAQEHMATAIVQAVMTVGLLHLPPLPLNGKRVLLACVEGNHHAVGLRMVADAFLLSGWDVQFLGPNVPPASLIGQVAEWKPHLVGLSVSFAHQMPAVKTVISGLQKRFGAGRPALMIGGLAINNFVPLGGVLGADAQSADALTAVAEADRVVSLGANAPGLA